MTETEWLTSEDPVRVIGSLLGRVSRRKACYFNLICCRDLTQSWTHPVIERRLIQFEADLEGGHVSDIDHEECSDASSRLVSEILRDEADLFDRFWHQSPGVVVDAAKRYLAAALVDIIEVTLDDEAHWGWIRDEVYCPEPTTFGQLAGNLQLDLYRRNLPSLRCIVGNPYRPVRLDSDWLTSTVVDLARGIYDERAFDRMPILADALQEAGCENTDILDHCRGTGPHVRGCWVVDLVLGKQ